MTGSRCQPTFHSDPSQSRNRASVLKTKTKFALTHNHKRTILTNISVSKQIAEVQVSWSNKQIKKTNWGLGYYLIVAFCVQSEAPSVIIY